MRRGAKNRLWYGLQDEGKRGAEKRMKGNMERKQRNKEKAERKREKRTKGN